MQVEQFIDALGADFYTGVPDSQLKALCNYLMNTYGIDRKHHIIAANEGNAVGIAAGYYLSTGKVPVVYLQNSGEGNIVNPVASLCNRNVYAIPMIFVIGWRGEPGVHDEPQHIFQGEITLNILDDLSIKYIVIDKNTDLKTVQSEMTNFKECLEQGFQVALVIKKGALEYTSKIEYKNGYSFKREEIIREIVEIAGDDPIISTTGKTSRELFEIREKNKDNHSRDFLTVGSMGHSSSIALGVAINNPKRKIWCIDGDGAAIMHMGAMATIGSSGVANLVHIIINNGAHESVGGMPTVGDSIDFCKVAKGCGYPNAVCVDNIESLEKELIRAKKIGQLYFIEIKSAIGSRDDLGRPTTSPIENKTMFSKMLSEENEHVER